MSVYPLPEGPQMANLEIVEVFEYYDGPQLFSCRSTSGCLYLVVGVEADETTETWLYAPVSAERLVYVRSGGMDLRTAFSTPEDDYLLVVKTHRDGKADLSVLAPADLNKAWLPVGGERLSLSSATLPHLTREDLQIKASQRWREHVALALQPPKSRRNEAPAALAGEVLVQAQGMIASIEEQVTRSRSPRGRLAKGMGF